MSFIQSASEPSVKPASRDSHIDTVKFLLILSIFIFHTGEPAGILYTFVNRYQVAIFFLVSGFWALNRTDRSPRQFLLDAFRKYLVYWIFWVVIYAAYHTVADSYTFRQSVSVFIRYFSGVRATGILGMWFTPAFFFVSFLYFLLAEAISGIFKVSRQALAWICCCVFFGIYYVTKYFYIVPVNLIFSLGFVLEYLFYYSLGTVLYIYLCGWKTKIKTSVSLKMASCFITLLSVVCFLLMYFKLESVIWGWIPNVFAGRLSVFSELVTVLLMFVFVSCIARCISNDFTAKIGRNTLGLCHCEAFAKELLAFGGSLVGLTVKPSNPVETLIFAFAALVFGCYVILPVTDAATKRVLSVNGK